MKSFQLIICAAMAAGFGGMESSAEAANIFVSPARTAALPLSQSIFSVPSTNYHNYRYSPVMLQNRRINCVGGRCYSTGINSTNCCTPYGCGIRSNYRYSHPTHMAPVPYYRPAPVSYPVTNGPQFPIYNSPVQTAPVPAYQPVIGTPPIYYLPGATVPGSHQPSVAPIGYQPQPASDQNNSQSSVDSPFYP